MSKVFRRGLLFYLCNLKEQIFGFKDEIKSPFILFHAIPTLNDLVKEDPEKHCVKMIFFPFPISGFRKVIPIFIQICSVVCKFSQFGPSKNFKCGKGLTLYHIIRTFNDPNIEDF